jgi:hypothetical protein
MAPVAGIWNQGGFGVKEDEMSSLTDAPLKGKAWGLSLDEWAVVAALLLALLARAGILTSVPW